MLQINYAVETTVLYKPFLDLATIFNLLSATLKVNICSFHPGNQCSL